MSLAPPNASLATRPKPRTIREVPHWDTKGRVQPPPLPPSSVWPQPSAPSPARAFLAGAGTKTSAAASTRAADACHARRTRTESPRAGQARSHAPRTLARTTHGPGRSPGQGRPGHRRGRWEAPVGALRGRRAHSPIVKDIPVAGRQPRPSGHFFPLPALRERRALPPLPLHRARLLGPGLGPPPPLRPPLATAAASAASVTATYRGCSGPRTPALRPQPGARRLCRPLGPLPALASPRSGGRSAHPPARGPICAAAA